MKSGCILIFLGSAVPRGDDVLQLGNLVLPNSTCEAKVCRFSFPWRKRCVEGRGDSSIRRGAKRLKEFMDLEKQKPFIPGIGFQAASLKLVDAICEYRTKVIKISNWSTTNLLRAVVESHVGLCGQPPTRTTHASVIWISRCVELCIWVGSHGVQWPFEKHKTFLESFKLKAWTVHRLDFTLISQHSWAGTHYKTLLVLCIISKRMRLQITNEFTSYNWEIRNVIIRVVWQ